MAGRSSTVDMAGAEASGYLLEVGLNVSRGSRNHKRTVTETQDWTALKPTGDIQKDLLHFYELEYKYSRISGDAVRMSPRRREVVLERMEGQAKALGAAIAEAALPTFESWIKAHDLEHLDVMGAERMKKLQKLYHAKGKTSNIHDWVLKQRTTGVSMSAVTAEEWLRAIAGDEASALRLALELLYEDEYAEEGDFDRFVKKVVARDPIRVMRRAIKHVGTDEQEAVVLQMFQTVYPIGYRKRLGVTSREVGRNILTAYEILEDVRSGKIDVPELFTKVDWTMNVVHQAGKMANHVAKDMGISVEYLDKLSKLDASAWDTELEAMSTPRGSVTESNGLLLNGWYNTRDGEFHKVEKGNTHQKLAMFLMDTLDHNEAWNGMFEEGYVRVTGERGDEIGMEVDPQVTSIRSVQNLLNIVPLQVRHLAIDFRRNDQVAAATSVTVDEFADATSWAPLIRGASKGSVYFESMDDAAAAVTYLAEQVGQGEWWIDDMGTAQFADGDIGDYNHAVMAMESILANEDIDLDDFDVPEIIAMEPLSREAREYLLEKGVNPKVVRFLAAAGDPREWMIMHHGWIRLAGSAAQMMEWDDATLSALREGVYEAWLSGAEEEIDPDAYVTIEEYRTHDTFDVPLKDLMNDRYDAATLRRIGTGGAGWATTMGGFTKAAWARKAAGERGIGEADEDDPIDWIDDWDDDTDSIDWDKFSFFTGKRGGRIKGRKLEPLPPFYPSWPIPGKLARSSRPGYPSRKAVPVAEVDEWVAGAKEAGIRSIIVLLGPDQLHLYKDVPGGLVRYYRKNGFKVVHVPTLDKHKLFLKAKVKVPKGVRWLSDADLKKAYAAYRRLPKPVLVHCSAGVDRSGAVTRYIKDRELGKVESVGLTTDSAEASSYLLEQLGQFKYKVPDDKEQQLYDFYMMTYLPKTSLKAPAPGVVSDPGVMYEPVDMVYALDEARKDLVPHLKANLLNAAFYSIACEARYIFTKTGADADSIVAEVEKRFDKDMAIRVRNYWKEYKHLAKYPVSAGKSFEAPGVVPEVLSGVTQSDRDASYRAALTAFEGQVQNFIKFASWGFWDRPWGGYNKKYFIKAMKNNDLAEMKAASGSYGGGNWGRIADGWLKLWGAKGLNQDMIYIDHLYSLQHNTGAVLNKVTSYAKNGRFSWIQRALDKKFGAESPYELAKEISSGMRRLAMPVIKSWHGTTFDKWAKDNPTKAAALATKAAGKGSTGTPAESMGDGTKKDYVRTKILTTRPTMKKSLLKWYHAVNQDNVDAIFAEAEKTHGFGEMKKWQFPVYAKVFSTAVKSSPPMVQGQNAPLVKVENGKIDTTDKHQYFDKDKPGVSWMSAKHLGLKPKLTHFRKETAAPSPPKPPPPPTPKPKLKVKPAVVSPGLKVPMIGAVAKMGFPEPGAPPVDTSGIQSAIQKSVAPPIDDVFIEVSQPATKIPAIKGIRQTYSISLKDAKQIVDFAEKNKAAPKGVHPDNGYLKFWWPTGNLVTLGSDVIQHPQAHWGQAEIGYAHLLTGKWEFVRSADDVKMINVNNRWYVLATRVMSEDMVEGKGTEAPKLGAQMTLVVKLGAAKPTLIDSLQQTFKVGQADAWAAVNAIPIGKLADMAWVDYALGTLAFAPDKFNKRVPVSVAMWSPEAKAVVPVEMAAWATTDPHRIFVMDDTVQAAKKAVAEAPVKPVDVHEGKTMYTVHDHGVGNAKLFGPTDDTGEVSDTADKMKKDYPNVGINEFIFINGKWQLLRQYTPNWKLINTNEFVFSQVKAKAGVKPKAPAVAEPIPSPKPDDVGVHFKIRVENPDTQKMEYVFANEFVSWSHVEKGIAELQDPESKIKGAPFPDVSITIEKWAHAKAWPLRGVTAKMGPPTLVEMMKPVPSKTEKGRYTALITFVDRDWEKTGVEQGPFPKDRAQAIAWAKGKPEPVARPTVDNPAVVFTVKAKKTLTGQHVAVFGNAFTHWAQVIQAIESMKDPGSGIVGAPIADSDIMIEKWANPIAWPPSVDVSKYRVDTSKPIKVEEIDVKGDIKWVHPAWSEVVEMMTKKPGALWYTGNLPYTVTGAIDLSKAAAAEQAAEPTVGLIYPTSWKYEPPMGTVEFYVAATVGDLGSGALFVTDSFSDAVNQASDCAGLWKKKGGTITGEPKCKIVARVQSKAWSEELEKKYPPPGKYVVEIFDADGKHTDWVNSDWEKLQDEREAEKPLAPEQATMSVAQALELPDLPYGTWVALNVHSDDALLADVWDELSMEVQSDIQVAIGGLSTEALEKKRADIYKVYPTVRDDVRYMIESGVAYEPEGVKKVPAGKSPESAISEAAAEVEKVKGTVTIVKQVEVTKGVFRDLHRFYSEGTLVSEDVAYLDPNVSTNKFTGLRKGVPHKFIFIDGNGNVTDLKSLNFPAALEEANAFEAKLPGDMFGSMYLWIEKSVFFKITGRLISGNNVWAVQYGLPEGYIKIVNASWSDATGLRKTAEKKPTPVKPETGLTDALVGTVIDTLELGYEAQGDLSSSADSSDDTVGDVWNALADSTKVELINAWREHEKEVEPSLMEKPWNAWTVQEVVQLSLSDEVKVELKKVGGGEVLGEVMSGLFEPVRKDIMDAISKFQAKPEPAVEKPKKAPKKKVKEPTLKTPTTELTFGQIKRFLEVPEDVQDMLNALQKDTGSTDLATIGSVWSLVPIADKVDVQSAHNDWRVEKSKVPQKAPKKKAKKKAPKKPTTPAAMKALQSWTVADALKYMDLHPMTVDRLKVQVADPKKQSVMSVWSLLGKNDQNDLIQSWKIHKSTKQAEPKKPKKGKKIPTAVQAEKNVKTWKLGSVIQFLDPSVHDGVIAAQAMTGKHAPTDKVSDIWSAMTAASRKKLVDAYIEFMKKKHGLESVSADASCFLLEAKKRAYPSIVRRAYEDAEGGLDLYFVRFREDGREYCYALEPSLRSFIKKIEDVSGRKAASIVKAKSDGEYDCDTGRSKRFNTVAGDEMATESAEASMYVLEAVMKTPYGWVAPDGTFHETVNHVDWMVQRLDPDADFGDAGVRWDAYMRALDDGWVRVSPSTLEVREEPDRRVLRVLQDLYSDHSADHRIVVALGGYDKVQPTWFTVSVGDFLTASSIADARRSGVQEAVYRSDLIPILEAADDPDPAPVAVEKPPSRGLSASDKKVRSELRSDKYPATAEDGKAFVFHWADGRGACAFKHKKDAIAWINDDVNCPNGPDIVGWWYDQPYCPKSRRDKKHKLRVATSYTPVKPKKKTESVIEFARPTRVKMRDVLLADLVAAVGKENVTIDYSDISIDQNFYVTDPQSGVKLELDLSFHSSYRIGGRRQPTIRLAYMGVPSAHRMKGLGSNLLKILTSISDKRGWPIEGSIQPMGTPWDVLESFYKKFGFEVYEDGDIFRWPGATAFADDDEPVNEDVDRDAEATKMLDRYGEEPTSVWLYTDMPVKDRVAWAYLAADRFKGVEGEDLVARFIETLRQVVDDPETFWQQIRERSPVRANYLDHLDWDIETVPLKDVGVYPRFSGFSADICQGSVLDTAAAIETTDELPERVAKLREMSDVWTTILKFLPPILVPGGILRSEERGYDVLKWTCDDGNHRLVAAAMAGADEAVCFVGTQKKEKIEPARLILPGHAESVTEAAGTLGWYNPEDDEEIRGRDHWTIVRLKPKTFGLTSKDVQGDPRGYVARAIENGWVRVNYYRGDLFLQAIDEDRLRKAARFFLQDYPADYVNLDVGTDERIRASTTLKIGSELDTWLAGESIEEPKREKMEMMA